MIIYSEFILSLFWVYSEFILSLFWVYSRLIEYSREYFMVYDHLSITNPFPCNRTAPWEHEMVK